jgi:hypothetical protein
MHWRGIEKEGVGSMREFPRTLISIPLVAAVAGTRALLGVGVGLLLSEKLKGKQRRQLAYILLSLGVVTTVPIAMRVLRGRRRLSAADSPSSDHYEYSTGGRDHDVDLLGYSRT